MIASKIKLTALILSITFSLLACSSSVDNTNKAGTVNTNAVNATAKSSADGEYPEGVRDEFLKSCVKAGSEAKFCECVFDKVKSKYSFEAFSVIESKISAGTPPDDFVEFSGKARAECAKSK